MYAKSAKILKDRRRVLWRSENAVVPESMGGIIISIYWRVDRVKLVDPFFYKAFFQSSP